MAQDPFPNTSDRTLEQRFAALFGGSNSALVLPMDPVDAREGLLWFNHTELKLKIYARGQTWVIGTASANP